MYTMGIFVRRGTDGRGCHAISLNSRCMQTLTSVAIALFQPDGGKNSSLQSQSLC